MTKGSGCLFVQTEQQNVNLFDEEEKSESEFFAASSDISHQFLALSLFQVLQMKKALWMSLGLIRATMLFVKR